MMTLKYGLITGGRAGDSYRSGTITIPNDAERVEEMIEYGDIVDITPNSDNLQDVLDAVQRGDTFCDWDVYGEGVFAVSMMASAEEIELAVRREYGEDDED